MNTLTIALATALMLSLGACETMTTLWDGAEVAVEKINDAEDKVVKKGRERFCAADIDMMVRFEAANPTIDWKTIAAFCPETYGDIGIKLGILPDHVE